MNMKLPRLLITLWLLFVSSASPAEQFAKPKIPIDHAISTAKEYIQKNRIDVSKHYLARAEYSRLYSRKPEENIPGWRIIWVISEYVDGGEVIVMVYEDGTIVHFYGR